MVNTGIVYRPTVPGLVPEIEVREAAVFGHYTWTTWQTLGWQEHAEGVAHFRIHRAIEMHQNDAVAREMKRKTAQRGSQG
ncbi:hypothetical protein LCGC14_2701230 [marine sediment metagenome]|uniref:Uncharacterized protein n=1 Tax=marine sediment metagenome TaxID=412755 RepID=A0A0F9BPZ6_9ZZZZ